MKVYLRYLKTKYKALNHNLFYHTISDITWELKSSLDCAISSLSRFRVCEVQTNAAQYKDLTNGLCLINPIKQTGHFFSALYKPISQSSLIAPANPCIESRNYFLYPKTGAKETIH